MNYKIYTLQVCVLADKTRLTNFQPNLLNFNRLIKLEPAWDDFY
jgi:hypothetical protein